MKENEKESVDSWEEQSSLHVRLESRLSSIKINKESVVASKIKSTFFFQNAGVGLMSTPIYVT